ncbi:MAG TPA: hypothetical protein DCL41_07390 [Bdellovibrionales bacterium]|nr:hypothetical protein [Pseudobdellovibrionaceae bacterium]HAG91679.1 hypothetical protein [Bdellovibrionales bacterium]|tara:strand:- start:2246 stop:2896 length:651 start_codon:yes stop_codon:yes gene_type:complete
MKVLGKSSLSAKIKIVLDGMWYLGIAAVGIWVFVAVFLLMSNTSCGDNPNCSSNATVGDIGFELDSAAPQLQSKDGKATAYFSEGVGKLAIKGSLNRSVFIAIVFEGIFLGFLVLMVIRLLRQLFKTFAEDSPFTKSNIRRLRLIAVGILGISISSGLFSFINAYLLSQQFGGEGIRLVARGGFNISTLFAGVVIFILAEIFRLGAELEDERAHTV